MREVKKNPKFNKYTKVFTGLNKIFEGMKTTESRIIIKDLKRDKELRKIMWEKGLKKNTFNRPVFIESHLPSKRGVVKVFILPEGKALTLKPGKEEIVFAKMLEDPKKGRIIASKMGIDKDKRALFEQAVSLIKEKKDDYQSQRIEKYFKNLIKEREKEVERRKKEAWEKAKELMEE